MKNHIAYTKGRCQEIPRPETMYQISMHSESTKSWVFTKPGNRNIRFGAEHSPEFLINQNEPATDPLSREQTTQRIEPHNTNLRIMQRIQGPVQENGSRQHLAAALRKGKLVGAQMEQ